MVEKCLAERRTVFMRERFLLIDQTEVSLQLCLFYLEKVTFRFVI